MSNRIVLPILFLIATIYFAAVTLGLVFENLSLKRELRKFHGSCVQTDVKG